MCMYFDAPDYWSIAQALHERTWPDAAYFDRIKARLVG